MTERVADLTGQQIRERLRDVRWIGGGSGAGKSTVAHALGQSLGWQVYDTDAVMRDHGQRISPMAAPLLAGFARMDMDQRWVDRTPEDMLDTFHWFHGEGFELIIDDLLDLAVDGPVIAEGFRLLPRLVAPLLADPAHGVWLLPTPTFRAMAFERRKPSGPPWSFIERTRDPERALANLLARDRLFTERLRQEIQTRGLRGVNIDPSMTEDLVLEVVARALGLSA